MTTKRNQITFDVTEDFKSKINLLAAKWGCKTNVAIQRAVEYAVTDEALIKKKVLEDIAVIKTRTDELLRHNVP